jgi:putative folate metabolism gamma-glutamate ligase
MIVQGVKTRRVSSGSIDLLALLDEAILELDSGSVVAITSKIVSLCENNTVSFDETTKDDLLVQESHLFLPESFSKYGHHFTITNNTLIPMAGIDESNGDGHYVLWPKDAQSTANQVREYLKNRFNLARVGVVITDSTCHPMRRGTNGIMLAHSGFAALNNYVGKPDLFGRPFSVSQADIAGGLSAAAVLQMGEGSEQTPLAVLIDLPFVHFQDRNPTAEELQEVHIPIEDDLFAPFLTSVDWQKGAKSKN